MSFTIIQIHFGSKPSQQKASQSQMTSKVLLRLKSFQPL